MGEISLNIYWKKDTEFYKFKDHFSKCGRYIRKIEGIQTLEQLGAFWLPDIWGNYFFKYTYVRLLDIYPQVAQCLFSLETFQGYIDNFSSKSIGRFFFLTRRIRMMSVSIGENGRVYWPSVYNIRDSWAQCYSTVTQIHCVHKYSPGHSSTSAPRV